MIKFEYYTYDDLNRDDIDMLWDQEVCMDDWDYMLFCECDISKVDWLFPVDELEIEYAPKDYNIEKLLTGCCSNSWYKVTNFKGRRGVLGVAYHA